MAQRYRRDSLGHLPDEPPLPSKKSLEVVDQEDHTSRRSRAPSGFWIRDSLGRPVLEIIPKDDGYGATPLPKGPRSHKKIDDIDTTDDSGDAPEDRNSDEEEQGQKAPPKPVGFWHKGLNKTRKQVFARWALMSKCNLIDLNAI